MDRDAPFGRLVDGRQRRAPIDGGQPAGIAMGQDIEASRPGGAAFFPQVGEQGGAVAADRFAQVGILVGQARGFFIGGGGALAFRQRQQQTQHVVDAPAQIDRGRTRRHQQRGGLPQGVVARLSLGCQRHAVSGGDADQRGAAHPHVLDGARRVLDGFQGHHMQMMGQAGLVDDLDRNAVLGQPERAVGNAVDLHFSTRPATASSFAFRAGSRASGAVISAVSSA